jgi:hypothetical protein
LELLREIPIDAPEIEYRYASGTQIYSTLGTWPISCSIAFMYTDHFEVRECVQAQCRRRMLCAAYQCQKLVIFQTVAAQEDFVLQHDVDQETKE